MKVRIHTLFQYLLDTTTAEPEAILGFSLSGSPTLGDYLPDLDPNLPLDWNQKSFQGLPALRAAVLAQAGLTHLSPDNVLITAGAAEANYLALMQLVQPGDHIVIETPGWPQAAVLGQAIGAHITRIQRHEGDNWQLPLQALSDAVTPNTRLIFLTNPNNPTGALMSAEDLSQIITIADRVGAWLLVDEVYAGLEWTAPRPPSIAGLYPRGITTGSVSKALGLQGLRTGWMITQDPAMIMDAANSVFPLPRATTNSSALVAGVSVFTFDTTRRLASKTIATMHCHGIHSSAVPAPSSTPCPHLRANARASSARGSSHHTSCDAGAFRSAK